jgi:hypothetical protein
VKYWEIIADNLKKAGWSWGCVSALDSNGRTIWIVDAHCGDGRRFIVHADDKLTGVFGIGKGGLYPPIERTMLTLIAATAGSVALLRADERVTAFLELEAAICAGARLSLTSR